MTNRLISCLFLLLSCLPAFAQDNIIDHNVSGDGLALRDGRIVRLSGIKAAVPQAAEFLATFESHSVTFAAATRDRYGRIDAIVTADGDKETLNDQLLKNGLAFVYPASGDADNLDHWLAVERAARQAGKGFWHDHPDTSSDDAESLYGHYGFVVGVVKQAERIKNKVFLNFGADWHTDFTVAIAAHDLRAFKNADIDLLNLTGKRIRVRGWVKRDFGPMITITDPHQLEILPQS